MEITGAELVVKALKEEGVTTLFAYPGGQAIDLFDVLYGEKEIEVILPRHEQGLIHAADGYARTTGKPGVCLVTSGPGATNLVTGIAAANYDCVPLVCFTGQVSTKLLGKRAFQEVDMVAIAQSICKCAVRVERREDLASVIRSAFETAVTGKPGVVVVDLPKDIQQAYGSDEYQSHRKSSAQETVAGKEDEQKIKEVCALLQKAERPVLLAGGGVRIAKAEKELTLLAERLEIPVVTTIMGRGCVPTAHKCYLGNLGIHGSYAANQAVSQCDFLLAIGTRFNDRITGKTETFAKEATVIHIDVDESCISRNVWADLAINADAGWAIRRLLEETEAGSFPAWKEQIRSWQEEHPLGMIQKGLTPQRIMEGISAFYNEAVIAADVGQNQMWAAQYLELDEKRQMITSGGLGTMGYGLPAAIGAKLGNPEKDVLVIAGDGGIQMNIQELATAVVYELPIVVCILNNGYLGNVRQWQEMFYQRRYSCTCMRYRRSCENRCSDPGEKCPAYTPDFVRLAQSYGAYGIRVDKDSEICEALARAKENTKIPTVIEFMIEREANVLPIVPPGRELSDMIF